MLLTLRIDKLVVFVLRDRDRHKVRKAKLIHVDGLEGIMIEDEKVGCKVQKLTNRSELTLLFIILYQKT